VILQNISLRTIGNATTEELPGLILRELGFALIQSSSKRLSYEAKT
jgi:hypothetical protein